MYINILYFAEYAVAPLVGAWIETRYVQTRTEQMQVAPLVGAWIETVQIRGTTKVVSVAPLVGAWIETEQNHLGQQ